VTGPEQCSPDPTDRGPLRLPRRWPRGALDPLGRPTPGIVLLLGVLVLAGVGLGASRTPVVAPPAPTGPTVVHAVLEVRSVDGVDAVVSTPLVFPAGSLVEFTLVNYDTAAVGAPRSAAAVEGTFAAPVRVAEPASAPPQPLVALPPATVSHTFSLASGPYTLNVPIPPAATDSAPTVISFALYFNATGSFQWFCQAYCDDGGLGGTADMGGPVTVYAP
jgi:hypothetical protein